MKDIRDKNTTSGQEVNLKSFLRKVYKNKLLFLLSICFFVAGALAYIYLATPKYEVSTSILIDPSASNRVLGDSKYVDGGVSLIEMEKNLYNEIGIIKSFSLINQTLEDVGFDVSYHSGNWLRKKEHYDYFPFKVTLNKAKTQLYNVPFEIKILDNEKYSLTIEANDFMVSNPSNGTSRKVESNLSFVDEEFYFGDTVTHEYFNFTLEKQDDVIGSTEFKNGGLNFIVHDLNNVTNSYMENLAVDNIDIQASIFKIVSSGTIVNKEVVFLKKLTENYVENKLLSRNKIAANKESFIRDQLNIVTDSLLKVESNLELFKQDANAVNLGATASNALGLTQNLNVDKAKLELDIKYFKSLIKYVENNRNSDDFVIPTSMGIQDPLINENISELVRLHALRSKKKFFITAGSKEMKIINEQIIESTGLLLNNLRTSIKSSEFSLRGLRSQLSEYNGVISDLPTKEKQLLNIERQSNLYENLFNYLSQELAKTGIARAENALDTRVLDEARMMGDGPVAPQKMLLLVLAGILGTLVPLAKIVFFPSEEEIENSNQIMEHTEIPVIASISHHDSKAKASGSDVSLWRVKESFRDLYVNLKFVGAKEGCTVVGMTSIMPEEGKTFCAINLGITLAEAGKKTLIIDTDLRSPSLVKGISKIKGKGLSNYLKGDVNSLDDIIYPHEKLSNLQFIPTDVDNGNILGLLSGSKMKSVFSELKENYDYIILDTPAVGVVSDFLLFSDIIDVNLFIVRRKIAKVTFLKDFEKLMLRGKKKRSYIVFNDILDKDFKHGYGQMYGTNNEPKLINDTLKV
ncbi:MAG: GumC family protein [Maribacter sp.]